MSILDKLFSNNKPETEEPVKGYKTILREKHDEILKGTDVIEVDDIPEKFGKYIIENGFWSIKIKKEEKCIAIKNLEDFVKLYKQFKKESIYYHHLDTDFLETYEYMTELNDGRLISCQGILEANL